MSKVVDNQTLTSLDVSLSTVANLFAKTTKLNSYNINATAISTGINEGGTIYSNYVRISSTTKQKGYRVDLSDAKGVIAINDTIDISGVEYPTYAVKKLITPEIQKTSGKYLSFTDISSTPITPGGSNAPRNYLIDISINISDI
jgi:hypothetical protein